jgi:hypothetical protein
MAEQPPTTGPLCDRQVNRPFRGEPSHRPDHALGKCYPDHHRV